jgi:hypothetical protein
MLAEFARSGEAGRSKPAIELADLFVSCRLERLDADPLRWSPIAVELCLLDWLPRKATLNDADIRAVPGALKRWVRFAGRKKGLAADAIEETLSTIDAFAAGYRRAMGDGSRFGAAKSLADAMKGDGVDLTDGGQGRPGDEAARRTWAMPPARGTSNGIDLALLDPAVPDDRSMLLEAEHPELARALRRREDVLVNGEAVNPRLHLALHEIVANQLWDGVPPETWAAAQRLLGQGLDRHDALHALMRAESDIVFAALREPLQDRTEEMRAALDALGRGEPKDR